MAAELTRDKNGNVISAIKLSTTTQTATVTDTSAAVTSVFGQDHTLVRVYSDVKIHILVTTTGGTATVNHTPINADSPEYFRVDASDYIYAIRNSADGTVYITTCE